jgi:uncharacterized zinc-type alcohol dehydrogenase-like protein
MEQNFKAYAAFSQKSDLQPFSYPPPALGAHDVEVNITHCGVCYSDIHSIDNGWGNTNYPLVPGHEIVGTVASVGTAVSSFKAGDRVGVGTIISSCSECKSCRTHEEQLCQKVIFTYNSKLADGSTTYGGYADRIRVHQRFVYAIPPELSSAGAAPLLCAGITTYTPFRVHGITRDHKVGVVGVGGLGHLGIRWAKALGCEVWAVSHSSRKEAEARALGADHFVDTSRQESLASAERRLNFLLITGNAPDMNYNVLLNLLDVHGIACNVGAPEGNLVIAPFSLIFASRMLSGSLTGGTALTKEMLEFAAKHKIEAQVQVFPVNQVNDALKGAREGKPRFRYVLEM